MEVIDQRTKGIMEACKVKAWDAGLRFGRNTLEYIVTNREMIRLRSKVMIPTAYDFWVQDVRAISNDRKYNVQPHNPYESVINTNPAISFYNDNNPDWLNRMIFYHVLGHIDFFQNNINFRHTWDSDKTEDALADKRRIAKLRSKHGRHLDYTLEFCRGIDNIVGFHEELKREDSLKAYELPERIDFYFNHFLPGLGLSPGKVIEQMARYNAINNEAGGVMSAEARFIAEVTGEYHQDFISAFRRHREEKKKRKESFDLLDFIIKNSPHMKSEEFRWKAEVASIVRGDALYFAPQIRTKIMNEGWASYWHQELFIDDLVDDDELQKHAVDFAVLDASVTGIPRYGLNPYAIGLRLIKYVEELANKGKLDLDYLFVDDIVERRNFDMNTDKGRAAIFQLRKYMSDFMLVNNFVDQDFVDKHNLFTVGKRMNWEEWENEYYVKSKSVDDYKKMLIDSLYHPPQITVDHDKARQGTLYLSHVFEGKGLISEMVPHVLIGIEQLWGGDVFLETTEIIEKPNEITSSGGRKYSLHPGHPKYKPTFIYRRVLYGCNDKKVSKRVMHTLPNQQ